MAHKKNKPQNPFYGSFYNSHLNSPSNQYFGYSLQHFFVFPQKSIVMCFDKSDITVPGSKLQLFCFF